MAKKKKGGGEGGANWMDTYGDMVTLLLCFFVLLYSMSTISEDKMKAIIQSFNPNAVPIVTDPEGNGGPISDPNWGDTGMNTPDEKAAAQSEINTMIEELYQAINSMVNDKGLDTTVQVTLDGGTVYISFSDTVFFLGDSSALQPAARDVLSDLCGILDAAKPAIDEIRVQGHTAQARANVRNDPRKDRELAGDRAMEVVLFLQENSTIHPARLIPEGYGQWRPISSNATAESRAPNRRVEMIISGKDLDAEALNAALEQYESMSNADGANYTTDNP